MKMEGNIRNLSNWTAIAIFMALAFVLYGNTLGHKYCLDDSLVIERNEFTKKGIEGIYDIFTPNRLQVFSENKRNWFQEQDTVLFP
jgi:protein O-mannosyl-transferase